MRCSSIVNLYFSCADEFQINNDSQGKLTPDIITQFFEIESRLRPGVCKVERYDEEYNPVGRHCSVLMTVFNNFGPQNERADSSMSYSQFIESVKAGQVQQVMIEDNIIKGKMQGGQIFKTYAPSDPHMVDDLLAKWR